MENPGLLDNPLSAASTLLGRLVVEQGSLAQLMHQTALLVADALHVEFCKIQELQADGSSLVTRAAVGWPGDTTEDHSIQGTSNTFAGSTLLSRAPLIFDDIPHTDEFLDWPLFAKEGISSGVSLVIPGAQAYGVLAVHSRSRRRFALQEMQFLQDVCDILGLAVQSRRVHDALRQSEEGFRRLFDDSLVGMTIVSLDQRLLRANRAVCELLGYNEAELAGQPVANLTHPDDLPEMLQLSEMLGRGEVPHFQKEKRVLRKNGGTVWVKLTVTLIRDNRGQPLHLLGMMEDLSQRRELELKLAHASFTVERAPAAITWTGPDGRIREVNESATKLLGFRREELLKLHIWDVYLQVTKETWPQTWSDVKDAGRKTLTTSLTASNGRQIQVETFWNYHPFEGGEYCIGYARDISEKLAAEDALRASEAWHRALLENSTDVISVLDADATIQYTSPSLSRVLGYSPADRIGKSGLEFIHPDDVSIVRDAMEQGRSTRGAFGPAEFRMRHRDGSWRRVEASANNLLNDPIVKGIVVNSRDITERRRAEEWFRGSFEHSGIAIGICSTSGQWLQVNPAFRKLLGYSARELRNLNWRDVTYPEDLAASEKGIRKVLAGKAPTFHVEKRYLHRNGNTVWGYTSSSAVRGPDGKTEGIVKMIVDISSRRQALDSLQRSESRFRIAAELASDFIFEWDPAHEHLEWYGKVDEKMGYQEGMFPRSVEGWMGLIHPSDRQRVHDFMEQSLSSKSDPSDCSYRIRRKDGRYQYWVARGRKIRDESANSVKWIGVCTDMTEQKQAEQLLRKSQSELRDLTGRLMRNEEEHRRALARELHDDLGQRLTVLGFDLSAIEAGLSGEDPEGIRQYLQRAQAHVTDAADDIRRLAQNLHPSGLELLGLAAALRELCREISSYETLNVKFRSQRVPASIPQDVSVCLYRIAQEGLRNVARHSRARKASVALALNPKSNCLCLSIRDDGSGFQPSASPNGGLGLISMEERARLVNGQFSIKSAPGKGTRLVIEVPL